MKTQKRHNITESDTCSGFLATRKTTLSIALLAAVFLTTSVHAGLLIYEGFDGYTAGSLHGQVVSTKTIGLNTTDTDLGKYASGNTNTTTTIQYQATGLSFSNLVVNGGSAFQNSATGTTTGSLLDPNKNASSFIGDLYCSYLIKFSSVVGDNTPAAYVTFSADGRTSTTNRKFASAADNGGNYNVAGVGYAGVGNNATNSTAKIPTTDTYMVLSRFTNVGTALSASVQGVATQWILSEAQFDYFKARSFAGLETATIGASESNVTSVVGETKTSGTLSLFGGNNSLQFALTANTSGTSRTMTIDELRFGESLADVTPILTNIPEPTTTAFILTSLALITTALFRLRAKRS